MMESAFSYFLTEDNIENKRILSDLPIEKAFGKYRILIDGNTPIFSASLGSVECAVFGLAIDVICKISGDDLARKIAGDCKSVQDLVEYEKQLGGKYVLFFRDQEQYFMLGDATSSIPIYYNIDGSAVCSSNYQYIVNEKKYGVYGEFADIRASGEISQAMPYDITPYKQVKQLIPNHFLNIGQQRTTRFVNSIKNQTRIPIEKATELVLPMIRNLLDFYRESYKIYCPITSGRDSRVVLSFLMACREEFKSYTIKHPEHTEHTQDVTVPVELCGRNRIEHCLIEDVIVPEELKGEMDALLGERSYSQRTLRVAQTIREHFADGAIINGDIIGQVGKCSLHRDIPSLFATPSYFRCKLHNYSRGAKKQLKLWLKDIKASGEKVNTFDLFSIENRLGRWAAQENLIYNTLGQVYLNIFNSRSIIYVWTAIHRKQRKKSLIHVDLIKATSEALLDVPFERDESILIKLSKSTGLAYLLSSYAKFYIEKIKHKKERTQ